MSLINFLTQLLFKEGPYMSCSVQNTDQSSCVERIPFYINKSFVISFKRRYSKKRGGIFQDVASKLIEHSISVPSASSVLFLLNSLASN